MDERTFIEQVERADIDRFARILARPTVHEEEVLVTYFGEERYGRMHERALQRNLRRAEEPPWGNVVVLHGIMGARVSLEDEEDTPLWPFVLRGVGGLQRLALADDGVTPARAGERCHATGLLKRYFGELLLALSERWSTRAFYYDWRKPIGTAAKDLAARVAHWFGADEPVHFVAHAMGGLVVRTYIAAERARWEGMAAGLEAGRGGRLIMLGTPNHGTYGVPRMLTGIDPVVKRLADREGVSETAMARIIATFPSVYELLPSPFADPAAEAFYDVRNWPVGVSSTHLRAAHAHHGALRDVVDPARMLYVAGGNVPTYSGVDPSQLAERDAYRLTWAGDGRVTHASGRLPGVTTYYADASHGDLVVDRQVLAVVNELLRTGTTTRLPQTFAVRAAPESDLAGDRDHHEQRSSQELRALLNQIATRDRALGGQRRGSEDTTGAAVVTSTRVNAQDRELEDNLLRDFLGGSDAALPATGPIVMPRADPPKIELALRLLDIGQAHTAGDNGLPVDVIAVGHYTGVKPQRAEKALDEQLSTALPSGATPDSGVLTDLTLRGTIPAGLGQPFFLDDPRDTRPDRRRLICLAGLGLPGRLSSGDLSIVVRELCWAAGRIGRTHIASVLIGAGVGNLSEHAAVEQWLRGIGEALAGQVPGAPRIRRVTLVELDPEKLERIDLALAEQVKQVEALAVEYSPPGRTRRAAARKPKAKPPADDQAPTRITLTREAGKYRFGAITATAAVPERDIEVDPVLVGEANDQLAAERSADRRRDSGRYLGRLLWPQDLRAELDGDAPVVMILDSSSARIHWELVARWPSDAPGADAQADANRDFLGVAAGFTRQLRTAFAPPPEPPPPPDRLLSVLVVADPAEDAHLPGAEEEGIEVANLFERLNQPGTAPAVEVVRLFGPRRATRSEVMRQLILKRFHVLHFAGHCCYDKEDPSRSGWVFTGNHRLTANELRRIDRVPEFIFSNACESGVTPDRAGNRTAALAPSFAEAFFERGVGNFVCTAWPVNDGAARAFAAELYGALLGLGTTPKPMYKAMRAARQAVLERADGDRSWGAYQHYGDPLFRLVAGDTTSA